MIIDSEDILILKSFYELEKEEDLWDLTKKLYPSKKDYEKRSKYMFLRNRIKRMGEDIFKIKKRENGFSEFILTENVKFCIHKFPNGYKKCLMINTEKKWMIFEL